MTDDEGREEKVGGAGEPHLSVVPPAMLTEEGVTVIEPDLQVSSVLPASGEMPDERELIASVIRLPLVSPPRDRVKSLLQRLDTLERGLAEVRARLDLISPLSSEEGPDARAPESTSDPEVSMSEAEKEDVFLGLQRLVLDRLRRAEEPD